MIIIRDRKIDAIKAIRAFCQETFGVTSDLLIYKHFVDSLVPFQNEKITYVLKPEDVEKIIAAVHFHTVSDDLYTKIRGIIDSCVKITD